MRIKAIQNVGSTLLEKGASLQMSVVHTFCQIFPVYIVALLTELVRDAYWHICDVAGNFQKEKDSLRLQIFRLMKRHYYAFDATLGYRMKAGVMCLNLGHRVKELPQAIQDINFFEIATDSYGFIANKVGEERNYKALAQDKTVFKILISGNSTTAGFGASCPERNWPSLLEQKLNTCSSKLSKRYRKIVVINASTIGYKISQEIKRFQEETIYLNPNMLIVFSGVKEPFSYHGNPVDYASHIEQLKINDRLNDTGTANSRQTREEICETKIATYPYRKPEYISLSAPDLFLSKVKQFKGICDAQDIVCKFILQPAMGVGLKELSQRESSLTKYFDEYFFGIPWDNYLDQAKSFYGNVAKDLNEDYQYNFLDVFDGIKETVYSDPRHYNDFGQELLAEKIFQIITQAS